MLLRIAVCACFLLVSFANGLSSERPPSSGPAGDESAYGNLPLYFIENRGQIGSDEAAFYLKGADRTLYFTSEGITFALAGQDGDEAARWTVKLDFVGAEAVEPVGEDKQAAVFSYFRGNKKDWKTGAATYGRLVYRDLWPGIDLVYTGTVNRLKHEFVVNPGADPNLIHLAYRGVTDFTVTEAGSLVATTPCGEIVDDVPYAYQILDGERCEVEMRFAPGEAEGGVHSYGFTVGDYDRGAPLVLDPSMLIYCGYIGGDRKDFGYAIAVDTGGNAYVGGYTTSDESTFPVTVGPDVTFSSPIGAAFVAKVNPQGTALVYCGYIEGNEGSNIRSIAVDAQGNAYVGGTTECDESSFPVTVGPDLTYNGNGTWGGDAFVAKINAQGTNLDYCGYIGGAYDDLCKSIAVDAQGRVYVTGETESDETSFPVAVGPDTTFNSGDWDAFVARVNFQGTGLDYCGYIGGDSEESGRGIAVDAQGNVYLTGFTGSDESTFPVTVGPDLTYNGFNSDAYVAKINAQGTGFDYCGFIGGNRGDYGFGIAVDDLGCAYLTGFTESSSGFPVAVGPDLTYNKGGDAYVAKVNAQGTDLDYCGYIGGDLDDHGHSIAVDNQGNAYVTGETRSDEKTFPEVVGPDLTYNHAEDGFVARINAQGTGLDYCGYFSGSDSDIAEGIAVDDQGCTYVTGRTESDESSFPVTVGPDLTYNGGYQDDAFIAKLPPFHVLLRAGNVGAIADPVDLLFVNGSAGDDAYRTIVNPPGTPVSIAVAAPPGGPNPAPFVLYAWPGEAGDLDVSLQPFNIGTACFPTPLSKATPFPPPYTLVNTVGYPYLVGFPMLSNIGPAPTYVIRNKVLNPGTWTFQGIVYDNNSGGGKASLTNAIVLVQQ